MAADLAYCDYGVTWVDVNLVYILCVLDPAVVFLCSNCR